MTVQIRRIPLLQSPQAMFSRPTSGVYVCEDEPDGRDAIRRLLEEEGASVSIANSADEAIEKLRTAAPDLLLCDIGLPRKDGYQLIAELRRDGFKVPAIAVTAFARTEERTRALLAGYQLCGLAAVIGWSAPLTRGASRS